MFALNDETVLVNKYGVNTAIGYRILSDDEMRDVGFTDFRPDKWYYCARVSDDGETTFNVTIDKYGADALRIDILDEQFCQPYDYQYILSRDSQNAYAKAVYEAVEAQMDKLQEAGVLSGHVRGEYI